MFTEFIPYRFPYGHYLIAPYWADHDAQQTGSITWEMYSVGDRLTSDEVIERINIFIRNNTHHKSYNGNFVFVGNWSDLPPYPAGQSPENARCFENIVSEANLI